MKYMISLFILSLAMTGHADSFKNRYSLPYTDTKIVDGIGKVIVTMTASEAGDVFYLDTTVICFDRRHGNVELPPLHLKTQEACEYTGMAYLNNSLMVVGFHQLAEVRGPSRCNEVDNRANLITMPETCASLQPK